MSMKFRLKEFREVRGLTQQEMADKLFISRVSYAQYEIGKYEPSLETLVKISEILNVSLDDLLGNKKFSHNAEIISDLEYLLKKYK